LLTIRGISRPGGQCIRKTCFWVPLPPPSSPPPPRPTRPPGLGVFFAETRGFLFFVYRFWRSAPSHSPPRGGPPPGCGSPPPPGGPKVFLLGLPWPPPPWGVTAPPVKHQQGFFMLAKMGSLLPPTAQRERSAAAGPWETRIKSPIFFKNPPFARPVARGPPRAWPLPTPKPGEARRGRGPPPPGLPKWPPLVLALVPDKAVTKNKNRRKNKPKIWLFFFPPPPPPGFFSATGSIHLKHRLSPLSFPPPLARPKFFFGPLLRGLRGGRARQGKRSRSPTP